MDDGDVGTINGNDTSSDSRAHGSRRSRRDSDYAAPGVERAGAPSSSEIRVGAPLAPPPVFLRRTAGSSAERTISGSASSQVIVAGDAPGAKVAPRQPDGLRVVAGESYGETEAQSARSLSPATANTIDALAAAMVGPLAGGIAADNFGVFVAAALLVLIARAQARRSALTEREISDISPVFAAFAVLAMTLTLDAGDGPRHALFATGLCLAAGAVAAGALSFIHRRFVRTRIAVIGNAADAHELAWALADDGNSRYSVTGYVGHDRAKENLRELRHVSFNVRRLGLLGDLSHIVARHDIDLLVLAQGGDRLEAFARAAVCTERYRTRLVSLLAFEEAVFQRVALDQLNIAWMQHIMHPRFRPAPRIAVRAIDFAGALLAGLLTAPLWLAAAAALRIADRGPLLERRLSVGERGQSFSILKFRTTPPPVDQDLPCSDGLPLTRVGRVLRRTHVDALPLLLNVLRGDMSLVGPRPARPRDVARREQDVPFYGRRHLLKPGIAGWAQLRAGQGAAEGDGETAMLTLSRDLFYLKHQSLFLYVYVLIASLWAAVKGSLRPRAR